MKTKAQNSKNKKLNTNKGITLVALVITIIVLLILAGVAINMAINSEGLFGKANDAVEAWNTSVESERSEIQGLLDKIGVYQKVEGDPNYWETDAETGKTIINYKGPEVEDIVIPNYVNGIEIETIGENLFKSKQYLKSLTISNGIKIISDNSFAYCSGLTGSLVIPDSITVIGEYAFAACSGLTGDLIIPNSVETIETYAFAMCTNLNGELILSNRLTTISYCAFLSCKFTEVNIPNGIETIETAAFSGCSAMTGDLILPNSVKTIRENAFSQCTGLNSITIPNTVESIANNAFDGVKKINYSGSLTGAPWGAES